MVRVALGGRLTVGLAIAAMASGTATFYTLTGAGPFGPNPRTVLLLINVNLVLLLLLGALLAWRFVRVWTERRRGSAGARLHVRLVALFSLIAVTPTIVVAVFSATFFDTGLQAWFSERVRVALSESLAASRAYLQEHQQNIRAEALAMANDINRAGPMIVADPRTITRLMVSQTAIRNLTESVVFEGESGRFLAQGGMISGLAGEVVPSWAIEFARMGEVAVMTGGGDTRVRAIVRLDGFDDLFLLIGRPVDPQVLGHMERTERAVRQYQELETSRSGLQITFALVFVVVALLILFAAVLLGLLIATQIARPLSALALAAERVRSGDLAVRVPEGGRDDEIGSLARAFNRMTGQLEAHRGELMEAYRQIDERRRFTETVLSGVSAGVIGLDAHGRVTLPNRSAAELLGTTPDAMLAQDIAELVPEMAGLLDAVRADPSRPRQGEILTGPPARRRMLLVRIGAELRQGEAVGYVVTFDDITDLLAAQRKAAWADVARRIAHEIKNPLTPIQLSAERLKRKYLREIQSDPETFRICTDTIVRQVGDIGRMVDEFSAFARMPQPVIRLEDVGEIASQALVLQRNAHPEIAYALVLPDKPLRAPCDRRLIGQALTNLLQNAADAVGLRHAGEGNGSGPALPEGQHAGEGAPSPQGNITLVVAAEGGIVRMAVEDDGVGLPAENRDKLAEPYVTLKAKGTGLGLAIVKKIMEDHGGTLALEDGAAGRGARVSLILPAEGREEAPASDAAQSAAANQPEPARAGHGA
ncbi:MAG: PAS domain-containing sensor histidine kinase [Alphaproteobacteria bacterium]|nr:PAS domain-containing sensor histidine kinase [Alphaproteobacteria bacterium]